MRIKLHLPPEVKPSDISFPDKDIPVTRDFADMRGSVEPYIGFAKVGLDEDGQLVADLDVDASLAVMKKEGRYTPLSVSFVRLPHPDAKRRP